MAKKSKKAKNVVTEIGFKEFLEYNGNTEGLDYINGLESKGHKLTVKGGGYIGRIVLDTIYSYDVFASDANKAAFISVLQDSSSVSDSAVILAYCVINRSAHLLIKGDDEDTVRGYVRVIASLFEKRYNGGKQSVGYPFRPIISCKRVIGKEGIINAINEIHSYSPGDCREYPYNSYAYLMQGDSMANMVLGIELKIINPAEFSDVIMRGIRQRSYKGNTSHEKFNVVFEDLRNRYLLDYGRIKEDAYAFMLGELCARTGRPYIKVAKKLKCYRKRHDLTVTTLCSFMHRRECPYELATSVLGMGSENPNNLIIEVVAELNRLYNYSYDYILNKYIQINDSNYGLLATIFIHLNRAYGSEFATLCERFHIKRDFLKIRALCNF